MYIEQAYKGFHEGWRYVVGIMSIFIGWQVVGMLPLMGTLITKSKGQVMPTDISGMAALLGSNLFLFLMLLSFAFGLLATFLTVKLVHKQKIVDLTTSRKRVDWNRVGFAFLLWAIISIIMVGADLVFSPEDYVFNFKLEPFLYLLVIGVLLIPIQTSCEEYLMRGYLMQGIGILAKNRWVPLVITSLIFGLLHLGNPEVEKLGYGLMVYYIGTGLFLGIMTLMDEGLELALGFHAANNLTTLLLVTSDWSAFQVESIYRDISEPQISWNIFIPVLVIYPALLYIFSKKYGWKNWRERLSGNIQAEESIN